jgi:hypothetical protein
MAKIAEIVSSLRKERRRTAKQLEGLNQAIAALTRLDTQGSRNGATTRADGKRGLSAAARKRISAAKKAWWAKRKKAA